MEDDTPARLKPGSSSRPGCVREECCVEDAGEDGLRREGG